MTIATNRCERPTSLADFIRLMELNGDKRIKFGDLRPTRRAGDEVHYFRNRYFPAQRSFTLTELIPFVRYDHRIWPTVIMAIDRMLQDCRVMDPEHRSLRHFDAPKEWIPDSYKRG